MPRYSLVDTHSILDTRVSLDTYLSLSGMTLKSLSTDTRVLPTMK
jgi:hypothetical protein